MKKIMILFLMFFSSIVFSQKKGVIKLFEEEKSDSVRIDILRDFYGYANELPADSAKYYYTIFKNISRSRNDKISEAVNMGQMGYYLYLSGNLPQGLHLATQALQLAEFTGNARALGMITFGLQYFTQDNKRKINLITKAIAFSKQANDRHFLAYEYRNLGSIYILEKNADSAFYCYQTSYDIALKTNLPGDIAGGLLGLGRGHYLVGNKKLSLEFYKAASEIKTDNLTVRVATFYTIAEFFKKEGHQDSAIYYANLCYNIAKTSTSIQHIIRPTSILKEVYKGINSDSALKYTVLFYNAMDSMYGRKKIEQIQALNFDEEIRQQKMEKKNRKQTKSVNITCNMQD